MAYAQWVVITIRSNGLVVSIKNLNAKFGKFHAVGNKDAEISADDVMVNTTAGGEHIVISSCGRSDSPSGTEGSFDLYEGAAKIGSIYWNCPWGTKGNDFKYDQNSSIYVVQHTGANYDSGAIGNVEIKVVKF
eukprot:TRINITY_DN25506_c0_g1_i1.p1 TRINITY_DN25506_c0_g1~~TRINITY_DN25506_c0_g1_i1.p1  ORF type:complete len:133 (-),score=18.91 TRINITY_DN25506_c0_g1_i1:116-514(-)